MSYGSGRAHRPQEFSDLVLQPRAVGRQRLRGREHLRGRRAGFRRTALHGEADKNVPIEEGRQLVAYGKLAGAETEFVPYPGKAHGFDFSDTDPMTSDAIGRVTRFFQAKLAA